MSKTPAPNAPSPDLATGVSANSPAEWQIWLDRAVDGELSPAQEKQLLHYLESQPERWRACALAFWEAKAWHKHLGPACREKALTPLDNAIATAAHRPLTPDSPSVPQTTQLAELPATLSRAPRPRNWYVGGTLAAALLVAFTLGAVAREYVPGARGQWFATLVPHPAMSLPANSDQPGAAPTLSALTPPAPAPERMQFQLVDQSGRLPPQNFDIPIIEVDSIDPQTLRNWQQISNTHAIESTLTAELSKAGHKVERKDFFYLKVLPDGRQILVPFHRTQVIPKTTWIL